MSPHKQAPVRLGRRQAGATLLVAMIFMLILALIAGSAIKATKMNVKVVGNMQLQKESEAAAQHAVETILGTPFTAAPAASSVAIDINDSGQAGSTYVVNVATPKCKGVKAIKLTDLDASNADDEPCYASGAQQNTGIAGASTAGNSLCSNSNWEIEATATDPAGGGATATTHQGVALRVAVGTTC